MKKALPIKEILRKNKNAIEAIFPPKKADGKPKVDEKGKIERKLTNVEKKKIKREQDERENKEEKNIEEIETAM